MIFINQPFVRPYNRRRKKQEKPRGVGGYPWKVDGNSHPDSKRQRRAIQAARQRRQMQQIERSFYVEC